MFNFQITIKLPVGGTCPVPPVEEPKGVIVLASLSLNLNRGNKTRGAVYRTPHILMPYVLVGFLAPLFVKIHPSRCLPL